MKHKTAALTSRRFVLSFCFWEVRSAAGQRLPPLSPEGRVLQRKEPIKGWPPAGNKKGLIDATITDSAITGKSAVYVWDCYNTAGEGDNIKLTLNGTATLTSAGTYAEKDATVASHNDGIYPDSNGGIIVDYSTASGDYNLVVTDNR